MATSNTGKLGGKELTEALKKLASEAFTVDDAGDPVTRAQILADWLWKYAIGYTEKIRDDNGTQKEVIHEPKAWAMQYIFERIVGKAAPAIQDESDGIKAADRVRKLSKDRINALASIAQGPPKAKPKTIEDYDGQK